MTMETKHTPGPWDTRSLGPWSTGSDKGSHSSWAVGTKRDVIAIVVTHKHHDDPEFIANARLIAAAPEFLDALAWFINDIDGTHTMMVDFDANVERARAAIAKAEGRE